MTPDRSHDSRNLFARWFRLSLRARGVAVLVVPIAALFVALFSVYWMERESSDAERTLARVSDTRAELLQLTILLRDLDAAVSGYLTAREGRYLASYDTARAAAEQSLQHLAFLASGDPASAGALEEIRRSYREAAQIFDELRSGQAASPARLLDRAKPAIGQIQTRLASLNRVQDARLLGGRNERDMARRKLFRIVMFCGVLGPLGALFVNLIVAGRLVRRLQAVGENARLMAHGLPLERFASGDDEIAWLARGIEDAACLLRERERELRDSERRYRDLFDQAPIPYEETGREGVIRRFNQAVCTLLKCPPDRILGRRAWDFAAPDRQDSLRAAMMERLASGSETGPYECEYFLEDGSRIEVEIRETPIRDNSGAVTGVCRSLMDVTERNIAAMAARKVEQYAMELRNKNEQLARALDAARSATEAKSRFLAGISHELRTPLNGIIGFSELMHDGRVGPVSDQHREFLSDILTSARHLLRLINDILDLSKIEAGRMEFRPERRLVHALVYEVCDVIRPLAEKKNMQISTDVPRDVVVVLDASRFKQVLYNYLSNAVKFTPPGGDVSVRVSLEENSRFRLEVEDTGIGIETAELPLLFKEFQQLPNSRKAEQGTGLGLALTRTIVEAQGGSVAVRSQPGRGSVFSAVLPLDTTGVVPGQG
jgi:PAS domain S-box-containing protein